PPAYGAQSHAPRARPAGGIRRCAAARVLPTSGGARRTRGVRCRRVARPRGRARRRGGKRVERAAARSRGVKDRLFTLALAIGALVAFYALFFRSPLPAANEKVTRPLTTEAGPNGYLGLQRWLAAEHVPTMSLRERYGHLARVAPSPTGNLL